MSNMEVQTTITDTPAPAVAKTVSLYRRPYAWVKRFIDILLSIILLVPAGLIIGACYIFIKLETRGPAFFVQERPGYKGRIFKILKLRTMNVETERDGHELSDIVGERRNYKAAHSGVLSAPWPR